MRYQAEPAREALGFRVWLVGGLDVPLDDLALSIGVETFNTVSDLTNT